MDDLLKWIEEERDVFRGKTFPDASAERRLAELAVIEAAEKLMTPDYADADDVGIALRLEDEATLAAALDDLRKLVTNAG